MQLRVQLCQSFASALFLPSLLWREEAAAMRLGSNRLQLKLLSASGKLNWEWELLPLFYSSLWISIVCWKQTLALPLLFLSLVHVQPLLSGGTGSVCCHITTETGASCRTSLLSQCSAPPGWEIKQISLMSWSNRAQQRWAHRARFRVQEGCDCYCLLPLHWDDFQSAWVPVSLLHEEQCLTTRTGLT